MVDKESPSDSKFWRLTSEKDSDTDIYQPTYKHLFWSLNRVSLVRTLKLQKQDTLQFINNMYGPR